MTDLPLLCLVAVCSYLVGAIPFGWIVGRWHGHDVLREGSGNIGATNVARVVGFRWGLLVFVLDFCKGALPVGLTWLLVPESESALPNATFRVTAGVAAFLGHMLPIYLRFRGGKGVATGAGVIAVLVPPITALVLVAWGVVLAVTRYVSIASMFAATLLFVLRICWVREPWGWENVAITAFCAAGAALVVTPPSLQHPPVVSRHRTPPWKSLTCSSAIRTRMEVPSCSASAKSSTFCASRCGFGSVAFFTIAGLLIFQAFADLSHVPAADRPLWFAVPPEMQAHLPAKASPTRCAWNKARAPPAWQ